MKAWIFFMLIFGLMFFVLNKLSLESFFQSKFFSHPQVLSFNGVFQQLLKKHYGCVYGAKELKKIQQTTVWITATTGFSLFVAVLFISTQLATVLSCLGLLTLTLVFFKHTHRKNTYLNQIHRDLPYFLDLTTACIEAGLDLPASIDHIYNHFHDGPLKKELRDLKQRTEVGNSFESSFNEMAEKLQMQSLDTLNQSILHASQLGTSLGKTFQSISQQVQEDIFAKAQEQAQKAPIKMMIPLIGLIFPVTFIIIFAPIALSFVSFL